MDANSAWALGWLNPSQLQVFQLKTTLAIANMHYLRWCTM